MANEGSSVLPYGRITRNRWKALWPQTWLGMLSGVLLVVVLVVSEIRWRSVGDLFVEGGKEKFYRSFALKDLIILCAVGAGCSIMSLIELRRRHQVGLVALPFHLILLSEFYQTKAGNLDVLRTWGKEGLAMVGFPATLILVCWVCWMLSGRKGA